MSSTAQTEDALLAALTTIRQLWPALMLNIVGSGLAGTSADEVTSLDRKISLRHEVTLTLNGWARVVVDDRALSHGLPLGTDTIGLCVLLERHARWFSGHEAAPDAVAEITDAAEQVRQAAIPQRREWMPIGTCPIEEEQVIGDLADDGTYSRGVGVCGGQVRAYPERDPYCAKCGTEAVVSWWERAMFPDVEISPLVTADELVLVVHRAFGGAPVKPSTIRQWIKRGVIEASGRDTQGRTLYDRGAVVYAIARRAQVAS